MDNHAIADRIIEEHTLYATAAGAIPIPLADVAAVAAVQLDLVRALARVYEVEFDSATGKALIASITGASVARVGASIVKMVPGVGWIGGGIAQSGLSAATTYAVGKLFRAHFEVEGSLRDMDPEESRSTFEGLVERGRGIAQTFHPPSDRSIEETTILLEKLARLREEQVINDSEFEQLKGELFTGE